MWLEPKDEEDEDESNEDPVDDRTDDFPEYELPVGDLNERI